MIEAAKIKGHFVQKFSDEEDLLMKSYLTKYMVRLKMDLDRIASARIREAKYDGILTFAIQQTGAKELTVTPSDPVLFKKLEFGEFDESGQLKTPPHSVMKEWRVFIRT